MDGNGTTRPTRLATGGNLAHLAAGETQWAEWHWGPASGAMTQCLIKSGCQMTSV